MCRFNRYLPQFDLLLRRFAQDCLTSRKLTQRWSFPLRTSHTFIKKDKQFKLKKAHIAENPGFTYRGEVTLVTDKYVCMFHPKR